MDKFPALIAALILGGFGLVGAALVGLSHEGTKDIIAENERLALLHQLQTLVPDQHYDNELLADAISIKAPGQLGTEQTRVYRARKNGVPVAAVFSPVSRPGYAGDIRMIIAIWADGKLAGVRVVGHKETPGLGDKLEIERSDWILGFNNRSLGDPPPGKWKVKRDGGVFDQFTGATITPRTVIIAVRQALEYFQEHRQHLFEIPAMAIAEESSD